MHHRPCDPHLARLVSWHGTRVPGTADALPPIPARDNAPSPTSHTCIPVSVWPLRNNRPPAVLHPHPAGQMRGTGSAVARGRARRHTLPAKLHDQLGALPIALPGIPTPALDDPEAMGANHLLEGVWRVTPSRDLQYRVLDPCLPHGAAIDQLRVEGVRRGVEAGTALITPQTYTVNRGLPHAYLRHPLPLLPQALKAALGMKHVEDTSPTRCQMRADTLEKPIHLGLGFQELKHTIGSDDQVER